MTLDTHIDLIRHGEPVGGRAYRGDGCDDPLSETGWQQMRAAVADAPGWERVVSSPMRRCREFAEVLCAERGLPLQIEPRLREIGLGAWEGLKPHELLARRAEEYAAFYADPVAHPIEGGEPVLDFMARVSTVLDELLQVHAGERLLLVTHAGVIRAAVAHVLHTSPTGMFRLKPGYAQIARIRHDGKRSYLMGLGWELE